MGIAGKDIWVHETVCVGWKESVGKFSGECRQERRRLAMTLNEAVYVL